MDRYLTFNYPAVFLWGIAVLLGMNGFGRLVSRLVGGELARHAGWGIHCVWGMAVYLFAGGLLSLFGACGEAAISLMIVAGVSIWLWTTARGGWPTRASLAAAPWSAWPAFALAALVYAGGICWQRNVEPCDDFAAYYNFCEKLLSTGSFDEPFSWRRLASLGGHTLLQCSVLCRASYINAQAFEAGICPVILLGLILGFHGGKLGRSPLGLFIAIIALTTPVVRSNSTSHLTGVVIFLGLFATLDLAERAEAGRWRLLAVAGVVAAGMCSLRAQYVPAAGAALGFFWLGSWIKSKRPTRSMMIEAAFLGALVFAALLPWMIACYRSNGSPLFPLFQGDNNRSFNPLAQGETMFTRLGLPVRMILTVSLLPLILCFLAAPPWRRSLAAASAWIAALLASLALAFSIPLAPDEVTVPRYVQPLLLSGALAVLITAALMPRSRIAAWVFGAILFGTNLQQRSENLWSYYSQLGYAGTLRTPHAAGAIRNLIADYREAQLLVPEGSRILVCSDFPFLFDHERNPIWTIDMPNAASPAPGLPFQKPPAQTKSYLRGLGIEYLILVDFEKSLSLYNRAVWQQHAQGDIALWRIEAPFYLDFFNTTTKLTESEEPLGRIGNLAVIHFKP